jgi:hypothetical protein
VRSQRPHSPRLGPPTRQAPSAYGCPNNPALAFIPASGEPRARDLTSGAGPFRKRAWQVASLIHQTASGVLQ